MSKEKQGYEIRVLKCGNRTRILEGSNGEEYSCRECAQIAINDNVYALFQEVDTPFNEDRQKIMTALEVVQVRGKEKLKPVKSTAVMNTLVYVYKKMQEQTGEERPCGEEGRTIEEMLARERPFERESTGWIAGKKREMYFVDTVEVDDIFYAMYADKQEDEKLASHGVIGFRIIERGGKSLLVDIDDAETEKVMQAFLDKQAEERVDCADEEIPDGVFIEDYESFIVMADELGDSMHVRCLGKFKYNDKIYALMKRISEDAEHNGNMFTLEVIKADGQKSFVPSGDEDEQQRVWTELRRILANRK